MIVSLLEEFSVIEVHNPKNIEHQGTKYKFWYGDPDAPILFKEGKIQGENWAELVASELARKIGLPAAEYFPAIYKEKKGVVTPSFVSRTQRLVTGNELFSRLNSTYADVSFWKRKDYKLATSLVILESMYGHNDEFITLHPLLRPAEIFVGYLIFDFLIANQDRHDENWGLLRGENQLSLAPTYDHASSLACREPLDKRLERLKTKDKNYTIEFFLGRSITPFHGLDSKRLKNSDVLAYCFKHYSFAAEFWAKKIMSVSDDFLISVLDIFPHDWMSEIEKEFTLKMLQINRGHILEYL
ncbi:HipA domain-containing protein [Hydrogenovibrio sp. JE_KL2]|uniref:HipA domain-containing protein n=1 Tax=Hydrogenovibrio sp. JE_KL2 TaxID=2651188 RepID=UPI00128B5987|nr:HipA domain-containing protein [Hydrogenovibrio sp. JE_KL2]MPQ76318.1 hypothetical protein [Hydrogenovibrio sp. JE_KL2]